MNKPCCECAEPRPTYFFRNGLRYEGCSFCGLPIRGEKDDFFVALDEMKDVHIPINLSDEETAPSSTNRYSQTPAPEKKWEETISQLSELIVDDTADRKNQLRKVNHAINTIVRKILEEKAVEFMERKAVRISPEKKLTAKNEGFNEGMDEAAAILRR